MMVPARRTKPLVAVEGSISGVGGAANAIAGAKRAIAATGKAKRRRELVNFIRTVSSLPKDLSG
jgi:hypothetical protein